MEDLTYPEVTVAVNERPDQGQAEIGVVVEGAFIPFGNVKLPDLHERIHEAAKAEADAAESKSSSKSSSSK